MPSADAPQLALATAANDHTRSHRRDRRPHRVRVSGRAPFLGGAGAERFGVQILEDLQACRKCVRVSNRR
jgi:hypothetical protein